MAGNRTLILGGNGRMGKRYAAIVREHFGFCDTWDVIDSGARPLLTDYSHIIIATPTDTHAMLLKDCIAERAWHVLCEKPLCMDVYSCADIANAQIGVPTDIRVVCNWSYVLPWRLSPNSHTVHYQNWHTGPHGADWDCCQLHYLSRDACGADIDVGCAFSANIDGEHITLTDIDRSYIAMIRDWYRNPANLWGLSDAIAMESKVERIIAAQKEAA